MQYSEIDQSVGDEMMRWCKDIFPFNRSITGEGVRKTLSYIKQLLPGLDINSIASGTQVYDWVIPNEWAISDASIHYEDGEKILDFADSNLSVIGYSAPVDKIVSLEELKLHLYTSNRRPDDTPYVTSYYAPRWGFCMPENKKRQLKPGNYHVVIKANSFKGSMNYGEYVLKGSSDKEVLISTYVCHPSMANNELSGPVVATALARRLTDSGATKFTYRFVWVPETIGSIAYISQNLQNLKKNVAVGFNVTCVGDNRCFSYMPTRSGQHYVDKIAKHVLRHIDKNYKTYNFTDRGSDERQYCSPRVDLPVVSMMRSKYGEYPEYHTSADDLNLISSSGLLGSLKALSEAVYIIENNARPISNIICEPFFSKYGLRDSLGGAVSLADGPKLASDIVAYSDGHLSTLEISDAIAQPFHKVHRALNQLEKYGIVSLLTFDVTN